MKVSYKAALLSAFVFPGIGHLYLKRYWRGLVILFLAIPGLGYIVWLATVSALGRLDDAMVKMQGGAANLKELTAVVGTKTPAADPYLDIAFYITVLIWIFSIIDAYRIGKLREVAKGVGG